MSNEFYVGCEVICIDDKVPLAGGATVKDGAITEGQVYRLRWVGMTSHYVFGDYLGVRLEGVDSKFGEPWGEPDCPFAAKRFRPLVKDPIAVFRQVAADPHTKIDSPEGPLHPNGPLPERAPEREREEV